MLPPSKRLPWGDAIRSSKKLCPLPGGHLLAQTTRGRMGVLREGGRERLSAREVAPGEGWAERGAEVRARPLEEVGERVGVDVDGAGARHILKAIVGDGVEQKDLKIPLTDNRVEIGSHLSP